MNVKGFLISVTMLIAWLAGFAAPTPAGAAGREVPPDALRCLALTVYFEAGSEPHAGKQAVAHVVLNRVQHPGFPAGVCGVVQQGGERPPCQFGWYCDGRSDQPTSPRRWQSAQDIARDALAGLSADPTHGALYFAPARAKQPSWTHRLTRVARIGGHVFYR